jgi:hypothetical protein
MTYDVTCRLTKDLLAQYNTWAAELGEPTVSRFADNAVARRRTLALWHRVAAARKAAGGDTNTPHIKAVHDGAKANHFVLNPTGQAAVKAARTATNAAHSEAKAAVEAMARGEQPRVIVEASTRVEAWRKPKSVKPGRRAYLPRPGSKQARMYELVKGEGTTPEAFADAMNALNAGKWTAQTVWGSLTYLFCKLRGYGLEFDGTTIRLVIPKEEQVPPATKG